MLLLDRYSFGVGDRFAHQAKAQLSAFKLLKEQGVDVVPVWNKSNREHTFIQSEPKSVLDSAKSAVTSLGWTDPWHVDADHIRLDTVDQFIPCSDFFTIDVADSIGKPAPSSSVADFVSRHKELAGQIKIDGLDSSISMTEEFVAKVASRYLQAVSDAGTICRHIASRKGAGNFITEVSMDETDSPQTPPELLVILAALQDEGIPAQTIAPKFTGRFNKGVDYVGDLKQFEAEFNDDLAVIAYAVKNYGLPKNLKLSIHSGSDKFSLYPVVRKALRKSGAGIHIKTAGTSWLEELIGLAESGGDGLELVKEIYGKAMAHVDELCAPYASVIDIDRSQLPPPAMVKIWTGRQMAGAIRHVPGNPGFNPHMRQLLHVSFKLAAKAGRPYTDLLKLNEEVVSRQVTENIFERHLKPLFLG